MSENVTGKLLIASPYLGDGNFMRSVIFMIRHDTEGAFGLVINRRTERRFRELVEMTMTGGEAREDDFIFRGGPVEGPLLALHDLAGVGEPCGPAGFDNSLDPQHAKSFDQAETNRSESTTEESTTEAGKFTVHNHPSDSFGSMSIDLSHPPAWITGDDDHMRILLQRPDANVRYVAYYSGWGPGQLDEEMRVGGWLIGEATSKVLFGDADEAWENAVKQCGHDVLSSLAPGAHIGDPNLN